MSPTVRGIAARVRGKDITKLTVAVEWVSNVILEAGNGALALHGCLAGKTYKGNHGQPTILDLLFPGVVIPQLQGVKGHLVQQP